MGTLETKEEKSDALASAAIAAVASALTYGLKKPLADRNPQSIQGARNLPATLESAPDMLVPLFENVAGAAGKWVAENSPDLIRDRLLPRFIGAFTEAAKKR